MPNKVQQPASSYLQTLSTINFLDKLIYKQPKSEEKRKLLRRNKKFRGENQQPIHMKIAAKEEIQLDQEFYAKFYEKKPEKLKKVEKGLDRKQIKRLEQDDDDDEDLSNLADQQVQNKIKELTKDDDEDLDFDDDLSIQELSDQKSKEQQLGFDEEQIKSQQADQDFFQGVQGLKSININELEDDFDYEDESAFKKRGSFKKNRVKSQAAGFYAELNEFEDLLNQDEISPEKFKTFSRQMGKKKRRGKNNRNQ